MQSDYSNNDPKVIGGYYLHCVKDLRHAPKLLRTDCGTENGNAAAMQSYIFQDESAHRYGKSTSNQRIEALWSKFRPAVQGWIDFFKALSQNGAFTSGNTLQTSALRWAFQGLIRETLDSFTTYWNTHHIANAGIPDIMFHANPTCGIQPDNDVLTDVEHYCTTVSSTTGDSDIDDYFRYVMGELNLEAPQTKTEALALYHRLVDVAQ